MINFFRKLRKKQLAEHKIAKYVFYALGEIVLVVIGILIALQINTWNEAHKTEQLELRLLRELKENLQADILDMEENIQFHERSLTAATYILKAFDENLPAHDSLNKYYGKVALAPKFLVTMTAYNSLNDVGMRILQNDSLRKQITSHYQRNYAYLISWTESEWNTLFEDQQPIYRTYFKTYSYLGDLEPVDYESLANDTFYRNYLANRIGFVSSSIRYYRVFGIQSAEALIAQIDTELKMRED